MGFKRQCARKARHEAGDFDERKMEIERAKVRKPYSVRIYAKHRESDCVRVQKVYGTTTVQRRLLSVPADCRVLRVNKLPWKRWVKPEHPVAMKRRLKQERIDRLASRKLPVV